MYGIKMPQEQFESSQLAQSVQFLQSSCTSLDNNTAVS